MKRERRKRSRKEIARSGGLARAQALGVRKRSEIAMKAVAARKWRPVRSVVKDEWAKPVGPIKHETIVVDYAKHAFRFLDHAHRLFKPRYILEDIDPATRNRIVAGRSF
jgi:hypothetical protein